MAEYTENPRFIKIKPYEDTRGSLKKILMKSLIDTDICEVFVLITKHGSIRGNHYHKKTVEYFAVISGTAKILLVNRCNHLMYEHVFTPSDNMVIKVPANNIHAFMNITAEPLVMLAVASREYNETDKDTYPEIILS